MDGKTHTHTLESLLLQIFWLLEIMKVKSKEMSTQNQTSTRSHLVISEQPNALHLMEDGVMSGVDLVPPVNISSQ